MQCCREWQQEPESGVMSMNEINKYRAFGLVISSEFPIIQVPDAEKDEEPDVVICHSDLTGYNIPRDRFLIENGAVMFGVRDIGNFRVTDGKRIEVDCVKKGSDDHLAVYLMGSCMGAVLHQRGWMPLHGSCVTDGNRAVLITGDSGAGKSTLACEFLSHGWLLMTDDIAAVKDVESTPMVQSSYPSQKLWQDSLKQYCEREGQVHSLYFNENREKFGVAVTDMYYDGVMPLSLIVRLIPVDTKSCILPVEGFARVNQLIYNTYRLYMVAEEKQQRHFQRCVTLSLKVPMALVLREKNTQCAVQLYKMIVDFLEDYTNE